MLLASTIGSIVHPIFEAIAWLLAAFYSLVPNYAVAISLLTIAVMILVFPLTRAGTRSMMRMQLLAPELRKIQQKYKPRPDMTAAERQEARLKLNEEMMALYRENGANPTSGCLPMLLQFPIFWVLYDVIRGLTHVQVVHHGKTVIRVAQPLYVAPTTRVYRDLVAAHGKMLAFGINLADSVRSPQRSWAGVIPYVVLVLIAVALQYVSIWQITNRNPAASQANPQMQSFQRVMPIVMAFIYVLLPAGVGVYFVVSSLFRIGQQEWMYKRDPQIREAMAALAKQRAAGRPAVEQGTVGAGRRGRGSLLERLGVVPPSGSTGGRTPDGLGAPPTMKAGAKGARPVGRDGGTSATPSRAALASARGGARSSSPSSRRRRRRGR
jgi:YidC/Oxa1 family membrane protein insertase